MITIVVPVYNRAHCLTHTLDSIAAQTLRPLRLIIVDNNSTDATLATALRWARSHNSAEFRVDILTESAPGAAAARNRGLAEVDTPWVMFFDSDDTMEPTLLQAVASAIQRRPDADIIGWNVDIHLTDAVTRHSRFTIGRLLRSTLIHGTLATQHYAVATRFIRRAGGWDAAVRVWDDLELAVRLLVLDPVAAAIDDPTPQVHVASTPDSITRLSEASADGARRKLHALALCEQTLLRAGLTDMTRWVDLRRVQLAADLSRLAGDDARALARSIMADVARRRSPWYRLIYHKHRLYPRGTYLLLHTYFSTH